jgi:hypothetical protein
MPLDLHFAEGTFLKLMLCAFFQFTPNAEITLQTDCGEESFPGNGNAAVSSPVENKPPLK